MKILTYFLVDDEYNLKNRSIIPLDAIALVKQTPEGIKIYLKENSLLIISKNLLRDEQMVNTKMDELQAFIMGGYTDKKEFSLNDFIVEMQ